MKYLSWLASALAVVIFLVASVRNPHHFPAVQDHIAILYLLIVALAVKPKRTE